MSTTARSARPISREISCVRPPILPFTLSRSLRSFVARGSIAYSAVTQPLPLPCSQRGTPFVNDAVQSTLVPPKEMSALPSACALQPRSMVMGRSLLGCGRRRGPRVVLPVLTPPSRRVDVYAGGCECGWAVCVSSGWRAARSGSWMAPVCTDSTRGTSGPRKRCARRGNSAALVAGRLEAAAGRQVGGAQQVVLDERAVDVARGLLGAGDERDVRAHHVLDRGGQQRVVRAAEHEGVDVRVAAAAAGTPRRPRTARRRW